MRTGSGTLALLALLVVGNGMAVAQAQEAATASTDDVLVLDGRLEEPFWQRAQRFDDFKVTQPFTLAKPTYPTTAYIIGLPQGIVVGFRVTQPKDAPHIRAQTPRDQNSPGDRVNLYIDFNADGVVAYNMTVALSGSLQDGTITNEVQYATDWDSDWQTAVREDGDEWFVEMLVPWTTASMRDAGKPKRTVGVLFDRVYATTSERSAWPGEGFERQRYVSNFARVEIDQYQDSLFRIWPYVSVLDDLVDDEVESKVGVDLFWKPSGDFQLAAALNPDFGQVESDELVVNFDAIETFFSDKRPFFTENQGFFDLRTPNDGYLIYTRRIGGPDDIDGRAADIDVAVKTIGSAWGLNYGVLGALESDYADDMGRAFYAQRVTWPVDDKLTVGYLGTYVDRPAILREAMVNAVDVNWRPSTALQVQAQVLASDVTLPGDDYADHGEWLRMFLTPAGRWRHELEVSHFGRELDFNDLGFQPRASYNELEWTTTYTYADYAAASPIRSTVWSAEPMIRYNDEGDRLAQSLFLTQAINLRSGNRVVVEHDYRTAGIDDLLTRGHGDVHLGPRPSWYLFMEMPRRGNWLWNGALWYLHEGLDDGALQLEAFVKYFVSDTFTVDASLEPRWSSDWLIWQEDNLLGRYQRDVIAAALNFDWLPKDGHELRAKLQWLTIDADEPEAYRVGPDGIPRRSADVIDPFAISNFGLQLRYRWTFAPESDFYAVYSRGGFLQEARDRESTDLFLDALDLRDADQILLKVRYRF